MARKKEPQQIHFVMLPLMSPGHFIPMLDLAKLLAPQNVHVTIVTVPLIASRFATHLARAQKFSPPLSLLTLPFPACQTRLPEGCESIDLIPSRELLMPFFKAIFLLQEPVEHLFEPSPRCIISDMYITWVAESARKFDVPRIIFDGMNCFTTLSQHNLFATKAYESADDSGFLVIPGLPDRVEMCRAHLPTQFTSSITQESKAFIGRVREASAQAYGVVINSFDELESKYVDKLKKMRSGGTMVFGCGFQDQLFFA